MKLIFKLETAPVGYRDPDIYMLESEQFNNLWETFKNYDLGTPVTQEVNVDGIITRRNRHLYSSFTGTNIRHILDVLNPQKKL